MNEIQKLKKLKKGDKLIINKEEYEVFGFDEDWFGDVKTDKMVKRADEIILTKVGEKPKALFPIFYKMRYTEEKGIFDFKKLITEEIEEYPKDFPEKSKPLMFNADEDIQIKNMIVTV